MPTFALTDRFKRDFKKLTASEQDRFRRVVRNKFVPDLETGQFRPGLRVKPVQGTQAHDGRSIHEMSWAPDGRATWQYGEELRTGEPHVIWRRIGGHEIFDPGPS